MKNFDSENMSKKCQKQDKKEASSNEEFISEVH
jgi:hypothetical protein